MSIQTSTGARIYISTQLPATFDLAGYGALTWTEIKEVTNIQPPSPSYDMVEYVPLKTAIKKKKKGVLDYGDPVIDYALDTSDTGQQMLQSAAGGATKNLEHSFKMQYGDGTLRFFSGRVFSSTESGFSSNSMVSGTSNVGVSRAIVKIPAISFAANYIANTYSILGESKTFADAHTFTRSTTKTVVGSNGLIQSVAIDTPAFAYDPVTLAPKGLLIEGSRTNLHVYSNQFDHVNWSKNGGSITANDATAPDGSLSADALIESAANEGHFVGQTRGFSSGSAYTLSVFWKPASNGRYFRIELPSSEFGGATYGIFDASTSVETDSANCVTIVNKYSSGWYRVSITATATATAAGTIVIGMTNSPTGTINYTGDGTSGIYIWGAQLEVGSFASSYIPTVASQVTRTDDVCTAKEFTSWYNQGEGSVFVDAAWNGGTDKVQSNRIAVAISDGSSANELRVYNNAGFAGAASIVSNVVNGAVDDGSVNQSGVKIATSFGGSLILSTSNGFDSAALTLYKPMVEMSVGCRADDTKQLDGTIAQLNYYPTALTDEQLQDLTR